MGIMGIKSRTENWKTAVCFSPLFGEKSCRLAELLGAEPKLRPADVKLELFWLGMRDYLHKCEQKQGGTIQVFVDLYNAHFANLRSEVERFGEFQSLKRDNYDVSTGEQRANLFSHLRNTEVDIVLETPDYLFVGEAKHEMSFGANGNLVLVHQLIRQYVMATILVEMAKEQPKKGVIPFVVGGKTENLKRTCQVRFMIGQGWLLERNVLGWDEIRSLA